MSKCISSQGEYSEHENRPGQFICDRCGCLDEDAIFAELDALRAAVERLTTKNERLAANQFPEWAQMLTPQACQKGKHPDWFIDSEHNHPCPWCELDVLRDAVAKVQALCDDTERALRWKREPTPPAWVRLVRAALAGAAPTEPNDQQPLHNPWDVGCSRRCMGEPTDVEARCERCRPVAAPQPTPERCSCGNAFDGDNLCMPSACQWEGINPLDGVEDDDAAARAAVETEGTS